MTIIWGYCLWGMERQNSSEMLFTNGDVWARSNLDCAEVSQSSSPHHCIRRGNLFTAFLCSTNTRKDLHPLLCFCLFSMNSYTEGKPLSSSWPVQRRDQKAQGNGIPGNVHCPGSHKCHQEGTGPGAPHGPLESGTLTHRKYRSVPNFQQLNSRSKEP